MLCIDIEFQWWVIPCKSSVSAKVINKIILALSYSYIAATFFHIIVNVIPYLKRKNSIEPVLRSRLLRIGENLRLCKFEVLPHFYFNKEYIREEFSKKFSETDLREKSIFNNYSSKLDHLMDLRFKIIVDVNDILTYKDYLDDDWFSLINEIQNSEFIKNKIEPFPDVEFKDRVGCECNQSRVGECIFDLYERVISFY